MYGWEEVTNDNLSGTNYIMVYGVGTPEENAAELQAAYNTAKTMPRFLGFLNPTSPKYMYAGQTFGRYVVGILKCYKVLVDGTYNPLQMSESLIVSEEQAKSTRTTVIVAPGIYTFGLTNFAIDSSGIDVVSLTGNTDVKLDGIDVTADNVYVKGIDVGVNAFAVESYIDVIIDNCNGGDDSFNTSDFKLKAHIKNSTGGLNSFGAPSDSGVITSTAIIENCKLTTGSWSDRTIDAGAQLRNCINSNGSVYSNAIILSPIFGAIPTSSAGLTTGMI